MSPISSLPGSHCSIRGYRKPPAEASSMPRLSTDERCREVAHHDLLRRGVEHGAAQLPAVARVAAFAGRAGIDYQHPADAADDLLVRMAVENDVGVGVAEAFQLGAGGQH